MPSALDRIDIAPPPDAGAIRSFGLALLIHAALIIALTWGVNWKRSDTAATFGAELWANAPQEAAPVPTPPPEAEPLPSPVVKPPVLQPPVEQTPKVDIALEQEKKRKQLKDQQLEQEKVARDKAKVLQAQADKEKLLKAEQLKAEQLAKAEQAKADALKAKQSQQAAVAQREDNMKRLEKLMADGGGSPQGSSTNRATAGGKGTSRTYGAIATAAIKPNVIFTEEFEGNPLAKVEVRLQSDGTIISSKIVQPSGNKSWDNAVLNAVIRTRVMPKDVDGTLPDTILILEFKPRF
ncbi:MAG: cell envelope integrity protein TolA [Polaromonas sp.]